MIAMRKLECHSDLLIIRITIDFIIAQLGSAIDDFALDFLHLVTEKVILILSLYF